MRRHRHHEEYLSVPVAIIARVRLITQFTVGMKAAHQNLQAEIIEGVDFSPRDAHLFVNWPLPLVRNGATLLA